MDIVGRCAVVTGGGHGIGRALAAALAQRGGRVVVADMDAARAERVAAEIGGLPVVCDVGNPASINDLVERATETYGPVEIFCSNAGMLDEGEGLASTSEQLRRIVDVNLLAHVWAAQAVVPAMAERGHGWFVPTISSVALVSGPMDVGYTFTKHGVLGLAEWIYLNYATKGVRILCLCPSAVNTGMLGRNEDLEAGQADPPVPRVSDAIEPEVCAELTLAAMETGGFLVLPHQHVLDSFRAKAADYDTWLASTTERVRAIHELMRQGA